MLGYLAGPSRRRNLRLVASMLAFLVLMVVAYSTIFHVLMEREGRDHSISTGIYWTLTVMSTLGFGDITFESDAGRIFSVVVLISGAVFILVLLPFAFIQFVFLPWVAYRDESRTPRRVDPKVSGHLVVVGRDAVTEAVVRRARDSAVPYVLVESDQAVAQSQLDEGLRVMIGDLDLPATYRAARVEHAALVATTQPDTTNANIAFTVRQISDSVPIVATATRHASVDLLQLAGCSKVLELGELLGNAIARRVVGRDGRHEVIGGFGDLRIAEATAIHIDLVDKTLREADIRSKANVHVVGTWDRGSYQSAGPDTVLHHNAVLILAGSAEQLEAFDDAYGVGEAVPGSVIVLGGGRVGRAAGRVLGEAGYDWQIVEQRPERIHDENHYVLGDAAELEVLEEAGLTEASAVVITTHDDDVNVYLTIYCRRLRPSVQIISRANLDRNVDTLHRAGADSVLSYASLGASAIWNELGFDDTLVLAEGLEVFRTAVPAGLAGKTLAHSSIRERTGCTVVAISEGDHVQINPPGDTRLPAGAELVVIADEESQVRFQTRFPSAANGVPERARR